MLKNLLVNWDLQMKWQWGSIAFWTTTKRTSAWALKSSWSWEKCCIIMVNEVMLSYLWHSLFIYLKNNKEKLPLPFWILIWDTALKVNKVQQHNLQIEESPLWPQLPLCGLCLDSKWQQLKSIDCEPKSKTNSCSIDVIIISTLSKKSK